MIILALHPKSLAPTPYLASSAPVLLTIYLKVSTSFDVQYRTIQNRRNSCQFTIELTASTDTHSYSVVCAADCSFDSGYTSA